MSSVVATYLCENNTKVGYNESKAGSFCSTMTIAIYFWIWCCHEKWNPFKRCQNWLFIIVTITSYEHLHLLPFITFLATQKLLPLATYVNWHLLPKYLSWYYTIYCRIKLEYENLGAKKALSGGLSALSTSADRITKSSMKTIRWLVPKQPINLYGLFKSSPIPKERELHSSSNFVLKFEIQNSFFVKWEVYPENGLGRSRIMNFKPPLSAASEKNSNGWRTHSVHYSDDKKRKNWHGI